MEPKPALRSVTIIGLLVTAVSLLLSKSGITDVSQDQLNNTFQTAAHALNELATVAGFIIALYGRVRKNGGKPIEGIVSAGGAVRVFVPLTIVVGLLLSQVACLSKSDLEKISDVTEIGATALGGAPAALQTFVTNGKLTQEQADAIAGHFDKVRHRLLDISDRLREIKELGPGDAADVAGLVKLAREESQGFLDDAIIKINPDVEGWVRAGLALVNSGLDTAERIAKRRAASHAEVTHAINEYSASMDKLKLLMRNPQARDDLAGK
jgi:hypothetical protein